MLKSIDDKLKNAEKKINKKQTHADIYYQQQREHGFDPFELDQEECIENTQLPKCKTKGQLMPEEVQAAFRCGIGYGCSAT